jgi:hypothetical protein
MSVQEKKDTATAYGYASNYREHLRELADVVNTCGDSATSDELREQAKQHEEDDELGEASQVIYGAEFLDSCGLGEDTYGGSIWHRFIETSLECLITGEKSLGSSEEWTVTGVRLLVTFGGPNCWIVSNSWGSGVSIECHWASDSSVVNCPELEDLGNALWELAEQ